MEVSAFRRSLLRWFRRVRRPLPWRQTKDPYAIWVSEVMLQQTTVAVVVPYYERFLQHFPTMSALAAASEDAVLTAWSGLGYYSRARNLWRGARTLVEERGGVFPRDVDTAMTLKGVGLYTASAVTSMAYGTRAAAVDGNVVRVLSRVHALRALSARRAQGLAGPLLAPRSPGAWNEAMMELGATICLPKKPRCEACPVSVHCRGRSRPEHWSALKPRRTPVKATALLALVEQGHRVLLIRSPQATLVGGLFELPHAGLPGRKERAANLRGRYQGVLAIETSPFAVIRHSVTHHRIEARIFRARLVGALPEGALLHPRSDLLGLPLGGLTRKALRAAGLVPT